MKCHQCGFELPATAKFCRSCGVSQIEAPATPGSATLTTDSTKAPQATAQKCIKCGDEVAVNAKFCRSCGANQNEAPVNPAIEVPLPIANVVEAKVPVAAALKPAPSPVAYSLPPVSSPKKPKITIYAVVGVLIAAIVGGGGYWGWTQKTAADEQAVQLAKQQADEQKRKEDEDLQNKLKEAEEKGRKEAENKAIQEAAERAAQGKAQQENAARQTQAQPQQQTAVDDLVERATKCENLQACMKFMLDGVDPRIPAVIQAAATKLSEYNKAQRGDRKAARALNTKGLDEFKNSNYPAAIDLLKQASVADPLDVEIQSNLGFVALRSNLVDVAAGALGKALLLDPRRTSTWVSTAEFYVIKGNSSSAVRAVLLGYEFSANKDKSMAFFEDKSITAERVEMRSIYTSVIKMVKSGKMN